MKRFDEIRQLNPDCGFALYAYTPGQPVTLEILTPDGATYKSVGMTAEEAIEAAFPSEATETPLEVDETRGRIADIIEFPEAPLQPSWETPQLPPGASVKEKDSKPSRKRKAKAQPIAVDRPKRKLFD